MSDRVLGIGWLNSSDPVKAWFEVLSELDEFVGIRYGFLEEGASEPKWYFVGHDEKDGIGGFASILRHRGVEIEDLPAIKDIATKRKLRFLEMVSGLFSPVNAPVWKKEIKKVQVNDQPPRSLAWHVFSREETEGIRAASRLQNVSVNSFLLKHLDHAVRQDLEESDSPLTWMVPVNLRGQVSRGSDEGNHSSYVTARVQREDTVEVLHREIYRKLEAGQHWTAWKSYSLGNILPRALKRVVIRQEKVMLERTVGAFSNLGQWDQKCAWTGEGIEGLWLFCPPVLRCQMIGAGCITFQNRLSLTLQVHPSLSTQKEFSENWLESWRHEINLNLI